MGNDCCCSKDKAHCTENFQDPIKCYLYLAVKYFDRYRTKQMILVDFGSSYGMKTIEIMNFLVEYLQKSNKLQHKPLIIHNDLSTNNWSQVFSMISCHSSYFACGLGRSFYEQCLPDRSLSIGYSSASLHHLSIKPCNILQHCYIHFGDLNEKLLFEKQAQLDFECFLQHRSRELHKGGILILNIPSRNEQDQLGFNQYFDLIYEIARTILSDAELIDFTLPFYLRSFNECSDNKDLFVRYSLKLVRTDFIRFHSTIFVQYQTKKITFEQFIHSLVDLMHSGIDSCFRQLFKLHQRTEQDIEYLSKQLWTKFEDKIRNDTHPKEIFVYSTLMILKKIE